MIGERLGSQTALRRQDERTHFRPPNCLLLSHAVPDAFVTRHNNPSLFTSNGQPFRVFGILSKMIIMNFDMKAGLAQNSRHLVPTKLAVEKENQVFFKRLLRG